MNCFVRNILVCCLAFSSWSFIPSAHSIDDVAVAIKSGNVDKLSRFFDRMVEITLHEKSHAYSRNQAETIIKDFFKNYGVESFKIVYKDVTNGDEFCVGDLQTKHGSFRTVIFMKARSEKHFLQEIRFSEKR